MSARKKIIVALLTIPSLYPIIAEPACLPRTSLADAQSVNVSNYVNMTRIQSTLAQDSIAKQLGWVVSPYYICGGYYLEEAFPYSIDVEKKSSVEITSEQTLFSQYGTSILEGKVTATRYGQQITSNKAYLYRDPTTGKLVAMEMIGDVHLREPNTLVIGKKGYYNFKTQTKSLIDILYRTSFADNKQIAGPNISPHEIQKDRKISALTGYGDAYSFSQTEPKVYEFSQASFSTCSPVGPAWTVKASQIVLNKNTGRGYATHARLYVKEVPVFYIPYLNFSIDGRRKSGFLWPKLGVKSSRWGSYLLTPFYWNMAPNYDMTITPGFLEKRGSQFTDNFRYLTHTSEGSINFNIVPHDRTFEHFQEKAEDNPAQFNNSFLPKDVLEAELNRLRGYSATRKGFFWRDDSQFNQYLSSHVDINYAGDDYYMRDFGGSLNELTANYLLNEADLYFKSPNWNFTGRLHGYQTLHPINEMLVLNQYRRYPQLILNGDYPDQLFGLEFFATSEATRFTFLNTPGISTFSPVGTRLHLQPGISWPFYRPSFYFNPRLQLALTSYNLSQTQAPQTMDILGGPIPSHNRRAVPIFDLAAGLMLSRDISFLNSCYQQTLEPQLYYTYIPYRNQDDFPLFDTTVNTLVYDQIFNYNRFSGIDRIGDANQVGLGISTRLIDQEAGFEKVRFGIGEIVYFTNRRVTLCVNPAFCTDNPNNPSNRWSLSPLSSQLNYNVSPAWGVGAITLWNPISKQVDNSSITFHYQPDVRKILNLGFSFVRNGDVLAGSVTPGATNNLKLTDVSGAWPFTEEISAVGRWSQDWNTNRFQNLLFGLQYDTCCWAVRLVGGKAFTHLSTDNKFQYNTEIYIQFALKGLGNVGSGNPNALLNTVAGYRTQFGQEL